MMLLFVLANESREEFGQLTFLAGRAGRSSIASSRAVNCSSSSSLRMTRGSACARSSAYRVRAGVPPLAAAVCPQLRAFATAVGLRSITVR
jgi:hypothetical protein